MSVSKRGRGKRIWLITTLLVISAAIAVILIWRGSLAGSLAEIFLQRRFGLGAQVAVTDIDTDGVQIAFVRLGDHNEAELKDIRIDYATGGWSIPVLQHIDIGDAIVHIGYNGELELGSLKRLLSAGQTTDTDGSGPLPIIVLHHLAILVDTPWGRQRVEGMATYDKDTLFTNLNWTEPNGAARFNTTATVHNLSVKAEPEGQFQATITPQSKLWLLVPAIPPKAGLISLEASLAAGNSDTPGPRLQISLSAQGIDLPQLAAPIDLHVATTLQAAGDEVMPPKATPKTIVFRDLSIDLKGGPSATFTGTLSNGSGTVDLTKATPQLAADFDLDLRDQSLSLDGLTVKEPTADLKLHVDYDGDNLVVAPTDAGKMTLLDIAGAPVTFPSLLTLPLQADGSQFSWHETSDRTSEIKLSLALGDIKAQVLPVGEKTAIGITLGAPKLALSGDPQAAVQGKLTIPKLQVTRQAFLMMMANVQMDIAAALDQQSGTANLVVSDVEMPNVVAPLRLTGKATLKGAKADIASTIIEPQSKTTLALTGTYDLAQHTARTHIDLTPLTFAVGGWQPTDIVPVARDYLRDIAGSVGLKGDINMAADGALTSNLNLALGNLSGKIGPAVIQNLNSVLQIDRPWPFSTAPGQSLAVEQVVLGLPFTNGLVQFDIDDGKTIKIDSGSLNLANGQVTLDPTTLSTDAPVQQLNLKVDRLGVDELFKLINISGLSGDGEISGNIPVSLFPDGVVIKDAKLAATGPGKLQYDVSLAPAAVKNAGDNVNMALGALSDFHYKDLVITLQRQLTGDAALGLHISGSNPSFYNGYPVEFNFTANGRLDEILRQGLAGYQVPDMIEQQLNQFR